MRKIRARAPLRLGLAGGGTDLSPYCDEFGGAALNMTIDRFAFASAIDAEDGFITFRADDVGVCERFALSDDLRDARLVLHRGVYERMIRDHHGGERIALTLASTVDAPAGSGLGSSSALVVALVEAMRVRLRAPLGPYDSARLAFEIERIDLGLAGGRQDQYAAAFGGINYIEFLPGDRVIVNPMRIGDDARNEVESSIVACFTGQSRESANIIAEQIRGIKSADSIAAMHRIKEATIEMRKALIAGDIELMAEVLNEAWQAKRATAVNIANSRIDELLEFGVAKGALGGKVSGAGGGGFMMFLVDPTRREGLKRLLGTFGGVAQAARFTSTGAESWDVR